MLQAELAYWINERWRIRQQREQGLPPPWSEDKVFRTVRFCNVHREDDKVTRWVRRYWNRGTDPAWRFVVARMINWPDSLEEILHCETPAQMRDRLKDRRYTYAKVFTSAYTVSTCGRKMDKLDYVFDHVAARVAQAQWAGTHPTLEGAYGWLSGIDGLGSFLSAQVVADMKNTHGHPLHDAPDWWTWSAPGPGSLRGLSWFFHHNHINTSASRYHTDLATCREATDPLINPEVPRISNQDFQNCLCEFSKWCSVTYINGHVRNKYVTVLPKSARV